VGAQALLVAEVFRLLEFADHLQQLRDGGRARGFVRSRGVVAVRTLVGRDLRRGAEVQHQVELAVLGRARPGACQVAWKAPSQPDSTIARAANTG
jgi:hypothetical protein